MLTTKTYRVENILSRIVSKLCSWCCRVVASEERGKDKQHRRLDVFFFSSRRRHTRFDCDWSSDVCSSDLLVHGGLRNFPGAHQLRQIFVVKTAGHIHINAAEKGFACGCRSIIGDSVRDEFGDRKSVV